MVGCARAFGALLLALLVTLSLTPACQPRPSAQSAAPSKAPLKLALPSASPALTEPQLPPGAQASSEQIPIGPSDATRGTPTAAVTIVGFFGLQCPFSARVQPALERLEREYGSERVRVVFMHLPLPFHQQGRPSADAAQAVLGLGGHRAFFAFVAEVYERQKELGPALVREAAQKAGVDPNEVERISALPEIRAQVDRQMALAGRLGVKGTPGFRINGVAVSGAQPYEKFRAIVDAELEATQRLLAQGVRPERLYSERVAKNFQKPERTATSQPSEAPDENTYRVTVGKSPVRGPKDALVTIVEFAGFQCSFSKKVQKTLAELEARRPGLTRIVFKHNPLPFHPALHAGGAPGDRGACSER